MPCSVTSTCSGTVPDAGTTSLTFGWDSGGPVLLVSLDGWKRSSGAVTVKLALGYAAGEVQCSTSFSAALKTSLGLPVTPRLSIGYTGASFNVSFFPLAADAVDGPMRLDLAPSLALTKGPDFEASLFQSLLLPLVTSLLFEATKGEQATPVWTGGRTVLDLLDAAGIVDKLAPGTLKSPQPELPAMIFGLLSGLAAGSGLELPIDAAKNLRIAFLADSGKIGVALKGFLEFSIGIGEAGVFFGMEPSSPTGMNRGLLLLLFDGTGSVSPELRVSGLGLGLRGPDGSALIDLGQFRLDAFRGYLAFDSSPGDFGAAMELEGLGLPLGIITGGGVSTDNPVVASLLESSGPSGGGRPGDRQPVNPRINLIAWWTSSGDRPSKRFCDYRRNR